MCDVAAGQATRRDVGIRPQCRNEVGTQQHPDNQIRLNTAHQHLITIVPLAPTQIRFSVKHLQATEHSRNMLVALRVDGMAPDRIEIIRAIELHTQFAGQPTSRHAASNPNHGCLREYAQAAGLDREVVSVFQREYSSP